MNVSDWLLGMKKIPAKWIGKAPVSQSKWNDTLLDESGPRVLLMNRHRLSAIKEGLASGDPRFKKDLEALLQRASSMIGQDTFTIVHKSITPPSGNKHDYFSTGQYWWPNPSSPDGLPFIRKDGEANPNSDSISDRNTLFGMIEAVHTLGLAYFFTNDAAFSHKASTLLQIFFLDTSTRMNPNLRYAQAIPGRSEGRGTGIIDGTRMIYLVDAVGFLAGSRAWPLEKHEALKAWFSDYTDWLLYHPQGKAECSAKNNHGTSYDLHVTCVALFCGKTYVAREILTQSVTMRMRRQIQADGRQPLELARSNSLNYSTQNLRIFFQLAVIGEKFGLDLWHDETGKGNYLQGALDFLLPFLVAPSTWPYEQNWARPTNTLETPSTLRRSRVWRHPLSNNIRKIGSRTS